MRLSNVNIEHLRHYGWKVEIMRYDVNNLPQEIVVEAEMSRSHRIMKNPRHNQAVNWDLVKQVTVLSIQTKNQKKGDLPMVRGFSFLSKRDMFDRKRGNGIALGRALKRLQCEMRLPADFLPTIDGLRAIAHQDSAGGPELHAEGAPKTQSQEQAQEVATAQGALTESVQVH